MGKVGGTKVNTLFNKVVVENEKCVLYFYLKTKGTLWKTQYFSNFLLICGAVFPPCCLTSLLLILVKAMVFLTVMYGCESWIIKKAEHQRIDAFQLWCWRRVHS